jgi:hypothetical protein
MLPAILAILGVVVGSCLVTALGVYFLYRWHTQYSSPEELFSVNCPRCTGGIQILIDRGKGYPEWGPIPKELNIVQKDGNGWGYFAPPQANKRNCTTCLGLGHRWFGAHEFKLPPPTGKRIWPR